MEVGDDVVHAVLQYVMMLKYVEESRLILLSKRLVKADTLKREADLRNINTNEEGPEQRNGESHTQVELNVNGDGTIPQGEQIDYDSDESYTVEDRDLLHGIISKINSSLHEVDFEISHFITQDDANVTMYTLVNKVSNPSIMFATHYTPLEIRALNELIENMFTFSKSGEFSYSLNPSNALDIVKSITPMTIQQSDRFLKQLELSGWLSYYNRRYTLSDRSLCELKGYLIERFGTQTGQGSISICSGCNEIVTRGMRCSNDDCLITFHHKCRELYVLSHSDNSCLNPQCAESLDESNMKSFF